MEIDELLAQVDYLLHIAGSKCDSWDVAQDLVQSTLLEGWLAIRKGTQISNAKGWLGAVLNRKYYDYLRDKYRKPLTFYGMTCDVFTEETGTVSQITDVEELTEEENIRRLIAKMTKQYREVIVRHYFHGQGIKEIANDLFLPENTVKSRLRLAREKLRKDFTMERYEKQSFEPENLWIASSGSNGCDRPYSLVKNDKITMNLLILAYEKPVTIPELADAIGISAAYIEPVIERLVDGELMKQTGDKVFTDFIIFTEKDLTNTFELQKELAKELCEDLWKYVEEGLNLLRNSSYYKRQNASQAAKLEGYFVLHSVYRAVTKVRDEVVGNQSVYNYPDRKDGGRWYAMGTRLSANYDNDKNPHNRYGISGEACAIYQNFPGAKQVGLSDYDTEALGKSHSAYFCTESFSESREAVTKLLYAVYCDNENLMSGISTRVLENLNTFIQLDFLERTRDGKLQLNVPVLSMEEKNDFYKLMGTYIETISTMFHDDFLRMIKNPVIVPKHIQQDVPDFLRYLNTCCFFPSALIYEVREHGLFLKGYEKPVPAALMFIDQLPG